MNRARYEQLRKALREDNLESPFELLAELAAAYSLAEAEGERETRLLARDLIIRCAERASAFGPATEVLDALLARVGLYPYLEPERLNFTDRLVYEAHRPLVQPAGRELVFHEVQAEVYVRLMDGQSVILTAPTSFGKSVIIDALVASGRFDTVVVIVPTIALIDEARRRLTRSATTHKVITHPSQAQAARTVYVMTQERVLELDDLPAVDLLVVDEFYKLNLDQEGERSVLLNQALYRLWRRSKQFYLLGPNIGRLGVLPQRFRHYNLPSDDITVAVDVERVDLDGGKEAALQRLVRDELDDQTLVYCSNPDKATEVARIAAETLREAGRETPGESVLLGAEWVARTYHPEWTLVESLRAGVGIHHGRIPRALAHWMVSAFNRRELRMLVCTQTLIEGVNTTARDVVVYDGIRNKAPLDLFTFRNIQGRSGRMFRHFVGRVWLFSDEPRGQLLDVDIPVLSQPESAPESLLLEVDEEDLTAASKDRLSRFLEQDVLSVDTLKANAGVDLDRQLAVAEDLRDHERYWMESLHWRNPLYPTYEQLLAVLELVWEHFDPPPRGGWGAVSAAQMTVLIRRLRADFDPAELIASQVAYWHGRRADRTIDSIVLDVLTFLRTGASFVIPRALRVIDTIQREVLPRDARRDLRPFAGALEGLFLPSPLSVLDEYGLPPEVGRHLADHLVSTDSEDGLDDALERLRAIPEGMLEGFEGILLGEAKRDL